MASRRQDVVCRCHSRGKDRSGYEAIALTVEPDLLERGSLASPAHWELQRALARTDQRRRDRPRGLSAHLCPLQRPSLSFRALLQAAFRTRTGAARACPSASSTGVRSKRWSPSYRRLRTAASSRPTAPGNSHCAHTRAPQPADSPYFDGSTPSANVRSKASVSDERLADAFLVAYAPSMRLPSFFVSLRFAASLRECVPPASNTWML